jgi:hypothetical protein
LESINILECINILGQTWEVNVKPETIANCFKKTGFPSIDVENCDPLPEICNEGVSSNEEEMFRINFDLLNQYSQINQSYEDYVDCDEAISVAGKLDDTDQYQ